MGLRFASNRAGSRVYFSPEPHHKIGHVDREEILRAAIEQHRRPAITRADQRRGLGRSRRGQRSACPKRGRSRTAGARRRIESHRERASRGIKVQHIGRGPGEIVGAADRERDSREEVRPSKAARTVASYISTEDDRSSGGMRRRPGRPPARASRTRTARMAFIRNRARPIDSEKVVFVTVLPLQVSAIGRWRPPVIRRRAPPAACLRYASSRCAPLRRSPA